MYNLTNEITTVRGLAHEIADGNSNDTPNGRVWLMVGPVYGSSYEPGYFGAWISTNGDPVYMATYADTGSVVWDASEEGESEEWLPESLGYFGWDEIHDMHDAVLSEVIG